MVTHARTTGRLVLLALLLGLQAAAGAFSKVTIEADTDKKQLHVGEKLRLKLVILQAAASQGGTMESLGSPELPELPGFQVYFTQTSQNVNMVQNVMQYKSVTEYDMLAREAGKQTIPAITYSYIDPQTHQQLQLQSRPIEVEVLPALAGGSWTLWLAGVGLIGAAAMAMLVASRGRRPAAPAEPEAEGPAGTELKRLRFFLDSQQVESFYGAVSDAVRAALERRYGLPTQVQTTADLIRLLQQQQVDAPTVEAVQHCLARCDLAKFAGYSSSPEEMHQTYMELLELLDRLQPPPAPAEGST